METRYTKEKKIFLVLILGIDYYRDKSDDFVNFKICRFGISEGSCNRTDQLYEIK